MVSGGEWGVHGGQGNTTLFLDFSGSGFSAGGFSSGDFSSGNFSSGDFFSPGDFSSMVLVHKLEI